jgi:hypothetical protein
MMRETHDLESLLSEQPFEVPSNFEHRVLIQISSLAAGVQVPHKQTNKATVLTKAIRALRGLALVGSGLMATAELFTFVFGLWSATNAF